MPLSLNVVFHPNPFLVTQVLLPSSEFCFFLLVLVFETRQKHACNTIFSESRGGGSVSGIYFFLSFRGSLFLKAVPTCASDSDPDPDPDLSPDPDSCYCADFVGFERVVLT